MLLTHVGKSQPGRRRILGLAGWGDVNYAHRLTQAWPGEGGVLPAEAATCSLASVSPSVKGWPRAALASFFKPGFVSGRRHLSHQGVGSWHLRTDVTGRSYTFIPGPQKCCSCDHFTSEDLAWAGMKVGRVAGWVALHTQVGCPAMLLGSLTCSGSSHAGPHLTTFSTWLHSLLTSVQLCPRAPGSGNALSQPLRGTQRRGWLAG